MKKVVVIGSGLLGEAVVRTAPQNFHIIHASRQRSNEKNIASCDLTQTESIDTFFKEHRSTQIVINCSAMSAVDACEEFPERARAVNALGVKYLAQKANECGAFLIHISTDYVFAGQTNVALKENTACNPCSIYGLSKLEGEQYALTVARKACVIRTSWLFGHARADFVSMTTQKLMRDERVTAIHEQIGSPTYVDDLAQAIWKICDQEDNVKHKIYHFANSVPTTRYEMVQKIKKFLKSNSAVEPMDAASIKSWVAMRPKYSVLSCTNIEQDFNFKIRSWESAYEDYFQRQVHHA